MNKAIVAIFTVFLLASCSHKLVPFKPCNLVSEQNGTLTLRSNGSGKTKDDALRNAENNALETILFRGVPGSQYNSPLVDIDEVKARNEHFYYFTELLDYNRGKTFVTSSVPVSDYDKGNNNGWTIVVDVTINVVALRKDLEQHDIIRKFGL